jgi:hypothetical protein
MGAISEKSSGVTALPGGSGQDGAVTPGSGDDFIGEIEARRAEIQRRIEELRQRGEELAHGAPSAVSEQSAERASAAADDPTLRAARAHERLSDLLRHSADVHECAADTMERHGLLEEAAHHRQAAADDRRAAERAEQDAAHDRRTRPR